MKQKTLLLSVIKYNGTQMNMMIADNYKYSDITEKIIEAFYKGYNMLGYGFLKKVYENAL